MGHFMKQLLKFLCFPLTSGRLARMLAGTSGRDTSTTSPKSGRSMSRSISEPISPKPGKIVVMKFGGSSLATGDMLLKVAALVRDKIESQDAVDPFVICSAMGKTTNKLVKIRETLEKDLKEKHRKLAESGESDNQNFVTHYGQQLDELIDDHKKHFTDALETEELDEDLMAQKEVWWNYHVKKLFDELRELLDKAFDAGSLLMLSSDHVNSYGERAAVRIFSFVLQQTLKGKLKNIRTQGFFAPQTLRSDGYITKPFDSWDFGLTTSCGEGKTDSVHSSCEVDTKKVFPEIKKKLEEKWLEEAAPMDRAGKRLLSVVTGYIAKDTSSPPRITTLGRDGSDYSATLFGAALESQKVIIFKEGISGVLSTDPSLLINSSEGVDTRKKRVRNLPYLTYEQAAELATFGASVVHPRAMEPLKNKNLVMEVRDTNKGCESGVFTVIGPVEKMAPVGKPKLAKESGHIPEDPVSGVLAITANNRPQLMRVSSSKMVHQGGYLAAVFAILSECNVSVDVVATSTTSISITTDGDANSVRYLHECAKPRLAQELDLSSPSEVLDGSESVKTELIAGPLDSTSVTIDPYVGTLTLIVVSPQYTQSVMTKALTKFQELGVEVKIVTKESDLQVTFVIDDTPTKEESGVTNISRAVDGLHRLFVETEDVLEQ